MYEKEVEAVQSAIAALRSEGDPLLIQELEQVQAAAATGLEYYGITKGILESFLRNKDLANSTRAAIKKAINAVVVMYTK
jgi:hypothetical protein